MSVSTSKIAIVVMVLVIILGMAACGRLGRMASTQVITSSPSSSSSPSNSSLHSVLELSALDPSVLAKRAVACFEKNPEYWEGFKEGMASSFRETGMSDEAIKDIQPADVQGVLEHGMDTDPEYRRQMVQFIANYCE